MAATFIPVSALTIFGVEQDNTYMISLKAQVKTLFNKASSDSLITSSTFTHTTGVDALTSTKVRMSTLHETLIGLHNKTWLLVNQGWIKHICLGALDRELILSSSTFLQKSIL
jgi:hypothetical protein